MKKLFILFVLTFSMIVQPAKAQEQELQQLILNLQKLNQIRQTLTKLYEGYQILAKGYEQIKSLSEGNFSLHKTFLDALYQVSPTVLKYRRIVEIINIQRDILLLGKKTIRAVNAKTILSDTEQQYVESVCSDILERSVQNLEELLLVITANQLRMNDAERLDAINRIYDDIKTKSHFLRNFNQKATLLFQQRNRTLQDLEKLQSLY